MGKGFEAVCAMLISFKHRQFRWLLIGKRGHRSLERFQKKNNWSCFKKASLRKYKKRVYFASSKRSLAMLFGFGGGMDHAALNEQGVFGYFFSVGKRAEPIFKRPLFALNL